LLAVACIVAGIRRAAEKLDTIFEDELAPQRLLKLAPGSPVSVTVGEYAGYHGQVVADKPVPGPDYVRVSFPGIGARTVAAQSITARKRD
jgi:hypothetical protein